MTTLNGWMKKSEPLRTQEHLSRRAGSRVSAYCAPRPETRATDSPPTVKSGLVKEPIAATPMMTPAEQLMAELAALTIPHPSPVAPPSAEPKQFVFRRRAADQRESAEPFQPITETRVELLNRLLDPYINTVETAKLLNVPAEMVVDYVNRDMLASYRGVDRQPKFRLSRVLALLEVLEPSFAAMSYTPSDSSSDSAEGDESPTSLRERDGKVGSHDSGTYTLNDMLDSIKH